MSWLVRAARESDLGALYEMAKLTGGGFTNLPADRAALAAKLARSAEAYASSEEAPGDHLYVLVLENAQTGAVRGTAQLFSGVGRSSPFYSYRLGTLSQISRELGRTFRAEMLTLTTDYEGCSEVGGLFLHPRERAGGLGMLLARSRYLFIAGHRARFAARIIAELRGVIDEGGGSPFWDGLGAKFFGMSFQEADEFNAINGSQVIADLMPRHPVYTAMLPEPARAAIGRPHPGGRAAMRMLEAEGFAHEGYVDLFDGGPTMVAATDALRSIRLAERSVLAGIAPGGARSLIASGRLADFRACWGLSGEGMIDAGAAALLDVAPGDEVIRVAA
ncbi:arginine N-succinyltransferase [Sphingomonas quercus]|uniref:Arginine N-succinyltransferase n=1 Tax=Sphingomonas quercus TaxID=2842451 RepID=A0ABS6BM51_9SPHN|nr:arginine N-succinyltransferase [Sphingomonas quercus]MBU3079408.1 arginine N-succinyltransferase [Sphingomonas quercus]